MSRLGYRPNSAKHFVFLEFSEGGHPSELTKKFKHLGYRTLMRYYEDWKVCRRKREELLFKIIRDEFKRLIVENPKWKRNYIRMFKRLEAKPLEWWLKKGTAKETVNSVLI